MASLGQDHRRAAFVNLHPLPFLVRPGKGVFCDTSASGIVAFSSLLAQRGSAGAVFTGARGPLTTLAATSAAGFTAFGNVAIHASGTVVFPATLGDGSRGVFTIGASLVDGSTPTIIPRSTPPAIP